MKVIIGLGGPNGAGKGTFFAFCVQILKDTAGIEAKRHSSGDIIRDCLKLCGLPTTRPNAQKFVEVIEANFQKGFLSNAMRARLLGDGSPCSFFDGVRLVTDLEMLEAVRDKDAKSILVFITATPEVRFKRMRERKEKEGENLLTWEQFLAQENAATERELPEVQGRANHFIDNSGTLEELGKKADAFCKEIILPMLAAGK